MIASALVGDVAYLGGYAAAVALAWVGVARHPPDRRRPWRLVAVGATLALSGDLLFEVVLGAPAGASLADGLWLSAYAALIVGLLRLQTSGVRRPGRHADTVIDVLAALVVGAVVAWDVALDDLVGASDLDALDRVVAGIYPLLDVALLAVVVHLLLRVEHTRPLLQAACGALVLLVADLGFAADADGSADDWLGVAWILAFLLLTSSTFPSRRRARPTTAVARTRVWMVLLPVAVPIGFLLRGQVTHDHPDTVVTAVGALALLALAALRCARLLREVEAAKGAVQEREHRFRALAANAADVVVVVDPTGRVKQGADDLAALLGVDARMLETTPTAENEIVADHEAVGRILHRSVAAPGVVFQQETEVALPDGTRRWVDVRLCNLLDDPVVDGIVVNIQDVTERRQTEDALRHRVLHDPLTGLANRALLADRIDQARRRGPRPGAAPALLHLDLVGFKSVNARFGREVGDRLLQAVADRLRATTRSEDTIARIGPDEMAVFIEDSHAGPGQAVTTAERILQALGVPIAIRGTELAVEASIGVAVVEGGTSADELMRRAGIALHRAKEAGPCRVVAYDDAMGRAAREAVLLEDELAGAVERGELVLHYQPLVTLPRGRLVAFEALVRWEHARLGLVPPDRFIPLAEQTGLIVEIGQWVLETACTTVAGWRHGDGTPAVTTVGVNLSARQLASDGIVDDVRHALAISGLDPRRLVVEMTETALVADPAAAARRLEALSALGLRIAIDDFGTGYSSLAYLRQFPIDILKIDGSFVETITEAGELPPIVRGLLDLGHTLGLEVVAEGIEHEVQCEALRAAGCDTGQGYLFSRPVPADQAERMVPRPLAAGAAGDALTR